PPPSTRNTTASRGASSAGGSQGSAARGRLTTRAAERGTVHEGLANDRCPTTAARLVPATVGVEAALEVAALPVDVDVQPVEGGASDFQCLEHDVLHMPHQLQHLGPGQSTRGTRPVQTRTPQGLVGVDVAHTTDQRLVQQRTFDLSALGAQDTRELI